MRFQPTEGAPAAHKAERVAMEEVRRGLVPYDVPTPNGGQTIIPIRLTPSATARSSGPNENRT